MKNFSPVLLLLSLSIATPVWSVEPVSADAATAQAAQSQVTANDDNNRNQETYQAFEEEQNKLEKDLRRLIEGPKRLHERLIRILNEPAGDNMTRWQKEIAKLKIKIPLKVGVDFGDYFGALVGVERKVEPTNVAGEQRLIDSYLLKFRVGAIAKVETGMRISFIRIFRGEDAKKDALFAHFYGLNHVPKKASDFLTDKKLKADESVRLEIDGDAGLGIGGSDKEGRTKKTAGASLMTGGTFVAEFNKINEKQLQARFVGLRSLVKGNVTLGSLWSLVGSMLPGELGEQTSVGPRVGFGGGYGADAMMVVYRFNMTIPEAMIALDEIFDGIKRLRFVRLFNPTRDGAELAKDLMNEAELAEKYALEYEKAKQLALQTGQPLTMVPKVEHLFRGRLATNFFDIAPGLGFAFFGDLSGKDGGSTTFVRRFNVNNTSEFFLLENYNSTTESEALAREYYRKKTSEIDFLATATEKQKAGKLLSIVSRFEHQESELDAEEMAAIKKLTQVSLPKVMANDPALDIFLPTTKQHSATWSLQVTLSPEALETVGKNMDKGHTAQAVYEFLSRHPNLNEMGFANQTGESYQGDGLGSESQRIAYQLYDFLNEKDEVKRAKMFNRMKKNPLYQRYILGQFLPSLIPDDKAEEQVHVKVGFASNEFGFKELPMGEAEPSNVINAVKYMRRILGDRDLNARIEDIVSNTEDKPLVKKKAGDNKGTTTEEKKESNLIKNDLQ